MADDKKYNGWTNYETWLVNLWLGNDQGSDEYWCERAQEAYDQAEASEAPTFTREEQATLDLSEMLKNEVEDTEQAGVQAAGLYADLLNAALSEVNWHEIAEHYIAEVDKEVEAE